MNRKDIDNGRCFYHGNELDPRQEPLCRAEKAVLIAVFIASVILIGVAIL